MLAMISPAKTLDFKTKTLSLTPTQPQLLSFSKQLITECQKLTPSELSSLMKISDKLAGLNVARFAQWQTKHDKTNARAAIYAFKGDVYTGLQAEHFVQEDIAFAQQHLIMLSGLYGILRPLDLIQPYRLEMGTPLPTAQGKNLYQFWGNVITQTIQQQLDLQGDSVLINLASEEYFKAINTSNLVANIIKPVFLDEKNGKFKVISFYAKKARGLMCHYLIKNRLTHPEQLKSFDLAGYYFDESASSPQEWVFKRNEQA